MPVDDPNLDSRALPTQGFRDLVAARKARCGRPGVHSPSSGKAGRSAQDPSPPPAGLRRGVRTRRLLPPRRSLLRRRGRRRRERKRARSHDSSRGPLRQPRLVARQSREHAEAEVSRRAGPFGNASGGNGPARARIQSVNVAGGRVREPDLAARAAVTHGARSRSTCRSITLTRSGMYRALYFSCPSSDDGTPNTPAEGGR